VSFAVALAIPVTIMPLLAVGFGLPFAVSVTVVIAAVIPV
jgi:hypothetical protein